MKINITVDLDEEYIYGDDEGSINLGDEVRKAIREKIEDEVRDWVYEHSEIKAIVELSGKKAISYISKLYKEIEEEK